MRPAYETSLKSRPASFDELYGTLNRGRKNFEGKDSNKTFGQHELLIEATKDLQDESIFHISKILSSVHVSGDNFHLLPEVKRVTYRLPSHNPMVSILTSLVTGEKMLAKCLSSLFEVIDYPNFEVILIDHDSSEKGL